MIKLEVSIKWSLRNTAYRIMGAACVWIICAQYIISSFNFLVKKETVTYESMEMSAYSRLNILSKNTLRWRYEGVGSSGKLKKELL